MRLVRVRLLTQAVVDVQGRHRAGEADGEVEQADRVAAARQQHDDRAREQAAGADALLDDAHGALARNRSVASVKPLSLTSPIGSKLEMAAGRLHHRPRHQHFAARRAAPTRAARLTARP